MNLKLLLGLALVALCAVGVAIWLKLRSSPAAAVIQACSAANAGNYSGADSFLIQPFIEAITNTPPKGSTRRFWDYYTRTQTVERVVIESEQIKDSIPPVTQFATVQAKVEFKNGESRSYAFQLGRGRENHWQILLVQSGAKSDADKPTTNQP